MGRIISICIISCFALLGLAGCSSDSAVLNAPETVEESVAAVSTTIGTGLEGLVAGNFLAFGMVAPAAARGEGCSPIDGVCTSGSAEACFNFMTDVNFTDCINDGDLLNGTISFADNGTNTTVSFDVTVNGVAMSGNIFADYDGTCVTQRISSFTMSAPGMTTIAEGQLTFCDGETWPSGTLNVAAQGPLAAWLVQFSFDGTQTAAVLITEQSTELSTGCSVNLLTQQVACSLPG